MTPVARHRFAASVLLGGALASAALPVQAATTIGTAAASKPGVTGTPPAAEKRVIEVGTNVLADERIVTTANAQAQILFNDGSSFSVGPDSDIVIDKFVFDPATGNGEMSLSVGKGVFRFVGGKISKNSSVEVKTPTATMGIRGGIATLNVAPGQPVIGRFLFGKQMSMTQNGVTQTTVKAGTVIEAPPGAPPSPPRPATPAEIRQTMSQLEAAPAAAPGAPAGGGGGGSQQASGGDAGGGGQAPSGGGGAIESKMESSGVSGANSAGGASILSAPPTTTASSPGPAAPTPPPAPVVDITPDPPAPTPPAPVTTTTTFAGVRGRTVLQGLGVQPYTGFNGGNFTATQNASASIGMSGLTTTTTAGVSTFNLALPGADGAVNLTMPISSAGGTFGAGSLFNVQQGLALNAVANTGLSLGAGLTGVKYAGYYFDNLDFFNTASVEFDPRFTAPFTAINTETPGVNFDETYSVRFFGFFRPSVSGAYSFLTTSDDASYLWLGNAGESVASLEARRGFSGDDGLVVSNGGEHPPATSFGVTGELTAGNAYPILIYFGENGGLDVIQFDFAPPEQGFTNDGAGFFFSSASGSGDSSVSFAGTTLRGIGFRADNAQDFMFYSLLSEPLGTDTSLEHLNSIVRLTHYSGTPTRATNFPTSGFGTHEAFGQFLFASVPFVGDRLVSLADFSASPVLSRYDANIAPTGFADSDARSVMLQATIGIFGLGADQVSYGAGMTGIYVADAASGEMNATGGMRATARLDATGRPIAFASNVGAAETAGGGAIYGSSGQYMVFTPDSIAFDTETGAIARTTGATSFHNLATGASGDEFAITAAVALTPSDVVTATARSSRTIQGFAGGLMETRTAEGALFSTDQDIGAATVSITTDAATNRLAATFVYSSDEGGLPVGFGSLAGNETNSAFINDRLFGASEAPAGESPFAIRAMMISHAVAPIAAASFAPVGVNFCDCPFMQWGWWAADVSHIGDGTPGQRDRLHLATWVAGELANLVDIPVVGNATYSGHAIGNVNNNGARYIAMGNFSQNWNFATRTGLASITNFDSLNVNLNTASGNGRDFSSTGLASGTSVAVTAAGVNGAFFRAPTDVAGVAPSGVGGQFSINATGNYQAAGTFVAKK